MSENTKSRRAPRMGGGPHGGGMGFDKPKNFKGTVKRLLSYIKPQRIQFLIVLLCSAAAAILMIFGPSVMADATDALVAGMRTGTIDMPLVMRILFKTLAIYFSACLLNFVASFMAARVSQVIVYRLRSEMKDKLDKLPLKYFDGTTHGEILSRMTNDIETVSMTLQQSVTQVVSGTFTFIGVTVMMFRYSWILALVMLVTIPLFMVVSMTIMKRSQKLFKDQQRELGELNSKVEEYFTGLKVTKLYNREQPSIEDFEVSNRGLEKAGAKAQFLSGMIMPLLNVISYIGYVLVCVIGGVLYGKGFMTIGGINAFLIYQKQFSMPITQVAQIANIIQQGVAAGERVFEIFDEKDDVDAGTEVIDKDAAKGLVTFEDIAFSYVPESPLIDDLNLTAQPGETIAIVGPTGAGKTTLVNLLMRFYELNAGQIKIDGKDITEVSKNSLRDLYGMVLQDTWLFEGTIRENIAFGNEDATEEEIIAAAKSAHIHHYIMTLPHGYDTVINENASNISQGQKQLLTIARAILQNPKILILDEAASSVETRTESLIQNAMNEMRKGRTSFVIAHRLSTIRNASSIIVMNRGSVVEQGTHEALLEKKGFYADLYNAQFSGGAIEESA